MKEGEALQAGVKEALGDKELPRIYFNGFSITISAGDVLIILKRNDRPIAILNTSHILAKTVATKMGNVVALFEQKTGSTIMTTDDVQESLTKEQET